MRELPERKWNRLREYDYSQNGAYFVTICVKEHREMLGKIVGDDAHIVPRMRLSDYGIVVKKYIEGIKGVDKYVVMPNHIHIIIVIDTPQDGSMWASTPTQGISQLVKSFKTLVSKEIGTSIFQRSYYDHVIRNDQDYREIWQYIDGNPLKWTRDRFYNGSIAKC